MTSSAARGLVYGHRQFGIAIGVLEQAVAAFAEDLRLAFQYIQPDAASSVTKSRIVLERLVKELFVKEMGKDPKKPLLGDMLADNQFTRMIERRILSRMNAVRDMANLGPHGESVHPKDAARVLDDLCEILDWYLSAGQEPGGNAQPGGVRLERALPPDKPSKLLAGIGIACFVFCLPLLFVAFERYQANLRQVEAANQLIKSSPFGEGVFGGFPVFGPHGKIEAATPIITIYCLAFAFILGIGGAVCLFAARPKQQMPTAGVARQRHTEPGAAADGGA